MNYLFFREYLNIIIVEYQKKISVYLLNKKNFVKLLPIQ